MSKKVSSLPKEEIPTPDIHQVVNRLSEFRILRNSRVRRIFGWIPAVLRPSGGAFKREL